MSASEVILPRAGLERVDEILEAVREAIEMRRTSIAADPSIASVSLIVRLDRGPKPDVMVRTEARQR